MGVWGRSGPTTKSMLRKSWHKLYRKLAMAKSRWQLSKGSASATIGTLLGLGWKPIMPNKWIITDGANISTFDAIDGVTQYHVLYVIEQQLTRQLWTHTAESFPATAWSKGYLTSVRWAQPTATSFAKDEARRPELWNTLSRTNRGPGTGS